MSRTECITEYGLASSGDLENCQVKAVADRKTILALEQQLQEIEQQNIDLQTKVKTIPSLQKKLQEIGQQNSDLQTKVTELQEDRDDYQRLFTKRGEEIEALKNRVGQLEYAIDIENEFAVKYAQMINDENKIQQK